MSSSVTNEMENEELKNPGIGVRHAQCLLLALSGIAQYWLRYSISITVVAMTTANITEANVKIFHWNEKEKAIILSCYFWGYICSIIPGGLIGYKFGIKTFLLLAVMGPSILNLIIPELITHADWKYFPAIRIVQGFCHGWIFPLYHAHIARWSPLKERNKIGSFIYSAVNIGQIIAYSASGFIAASKIGWPGTFYLPGAFGLLWSILWVIFGANSPAESKFISQDEKLYIEATSDMSKKKHKFSSVPWKRIFKSPPFYALMCTRTTRAWGASIMFLQFPIYLHSIMKVNIKKNSLYSSLPFVLMFILSYVFIIIFEILFTKKRVSLTVLRKTFNTIAEWTPALCFVGLYFVNRDHLAVAVTLFILSTGLSAGQVLGSSINQIDLSPNYAPILMGFANTSSNLASICCPIFVGLVVYNEEDLSLWQIIFLISAVIEFIGGAVYIIFGRMVRQSWDNGSEE